MPDESTQRPEEFDASAHSRGSTHPNSQRHKSDSAKFVFPRAGIYACFVADFTLLSFAAGLTLLIVAGIE